MASLDAVLTGPLEVFRGRMVACDDPRPSRAAADLVLAAAFPNVVAHFEAQHGTTDYRAIVSIWSKWHFAIVMPPVLTANLLLGFDMSRPFADARFVSTEDGKTVAMLAPSDVVPIRQGDVEGFEPLLRDHLAPFIERLSHQTGVTQRIFWSNAGNLFEAFLRRLEEVGMADRVQAADRFLQSRTLSDGRRNPLHSPVHYPHEGTQPVRRRRVCCLRYFVPDRVYCTTCPITRPGSQPRHD